MEPLSALASVVAVYQLASTVGNSCFRYAQGVRNTDKDGVLLLGEISRFQTSLLNLREMIAEEERATGNRKRLEHLSDILDSPTASLRRCEKELANIRDKLDKAQSSVGIKEIMHKMSWPLKQEEAHKTVGTLRNFVEAVNTTLAMETNRTVRQLDNRLKHAQNSVDRTQTSVSSIEGRQKREEMRREEREAKEVRERVLEWLAHPDPSEYHAIAAHARHHDAARTGRWFLDGVQFQAFRQMPQSILWLHGDSGCGKSTLCSTIIDELHSFQKGSPHIQVAYWYLSENDTKRMSFENLVRSLVTQLIPADVVPPSLLKLWEARKEGKERPKVWDLIQMLKLLLSEGDHRVYFIVIDALDESEESERADFMELIRNLAVLGDADMHVLVTSRSNTIGREATLIRAKNIIDVAIERRHADEDILVHIKERLQNDSMLRRWPAPEREDIERSLMEKAAGNFQWVASQLRDIRKCRKPSELEKTLKSLPQDMHKTYARDLARLGENRSEDARKLLDWLAFPQRPLRVEEAMDMLAIDLDSETPSFDEKNRMLISEGLYESWGSLVRVNWNPWGVDSLGQPAAVETLTAAHTSVIDFFQTQPIVIGSGPEFRLTKSAANLRMAEACLTYLHYLIDKDIVLNRANIQRFPFARLSAELWDDFYREVIRSSSSEVIDTTRMHSLAMGLFSSSAVMLKWIQICDPDYDKDRACFDLLQSELKSPIYYASLLGLPEIVRRLIDDGQTVNDVFAADYGTPLVAACVHGRLEVVSLLLDQGADPSLHGSRIWGCPLAAAISKDNIELVRMLLEHEGVNIHDLRVPCRPSKSRSSSDLGAAAKKYTITATGDCDRSEFEGQQDPSDWIEDDTDSDDEDLVDGEHDKAVKLISEQSMVYIAAKFASSDILELLLEAGASPDIRGGVDCTALQAACSWSDEANVRLLWRHRADAEIYGGKHGSALQAACYRCRTEIVRLFVEGGVNPNPYGNGLPSTIYLATFHEDAEMLDLLLGHGARVNIYGGDLDNPLQLACARKNIAFVRKLLRAGSDVNRKGGKWGTALCAACAYGSLEVVRLLLGNGADANIPGCGPTDDRLLIVYGSEYATKISEDDPKGDHLSPRHDHDHDLHAGWRGSALSAAFRFSGKAVIELLLENGADIAYKGGRHGAILHAAVDSGDEATVRIALESGLPVNEPHWFFTYPLIKAAAWSNVPDSIVSILLGYGADPSLQVGDSLTALQAASSVSKMIMLLDHGADVNQCIQHSGTALHRLLDMECDEGEMVQTLLDRGADVNISAGRLGTALDIACKSPRRDHIKALVKAGASLYAIGPGGRSPLQNIIRTAKPMRKTHNDAGPSHEVYDWLVAMGADFRRQDRRGCNCLHYAARQNNLDVLENILKGGADANVPDGAGWTPLHWAVARTHPSQKVIDLLLTHGGDLNWKDKINGTTPIDLIDIFQTATPENSIELESLDGSDFDFEMFLRSTSNGPRCNGCGIDYELVENQSWHRCKEKPCLNDYSPFDLCFRCFHDKDILHNPGHAFGEGSDGPSGFSFLNHNDLDSCEATLEKGTSNEGSAEIPVRERLAEVGSAEEEEGEGELAEVGSTEEEEEGE